jgi:hypothetical protein
MKHWLFALSLLFVSPVQAQDNYVPSVPNRNHVLTGKTPVTCPTNSVVIVGIGQSLAASHLEGVWTPYPSIPAYMHYEGKCYIISDPVLGSTYSGITTRRASIWTRVARYLALEIGKPVVMITAGAGGFGVEDWSQNTHGQLGYLRTQMHRARTVGLRIDFVVWDQGQTNTLYGIPSAADYSTHLNRVFDTINYDNSSFQAVQFLVNRASYCFGATSDVVRDGQNLVIDGRLDTHFGYDTDTIGAQYRYDNCHGDASYNSWVTRGVVDAIKRLNPK